MEQTEQRIDRLERLVADLDGRVASLERPTRDAAREALEQPARAALAARANRGGVPARPAPERAGQSARPSPAPAPAARVAPPPPRSVMFQLDFSRDELEDLVGGRVLAWVGGLAVLLGIVFLFALAITNGWIGETARVAIGAAGSAGLLALGVWLHERKARTDAALASVATGISGLFITITVAAQVYEVIPQLIAVVFAVGVGTVATALAVRWESRGIAVLGILGALGAPVLTGVAGDGGTMLILFVALASAAGVLLWQRWDWLAMAAFAVATPQWIAYLVDGPPALEQLAVLIGFGSLGMAVAIGHDVRVHAERLRSSSAYLLVLSAIVVSGVGWGTLSEAMGEGAGNAWLAGMALVHLSVGLGGRLLRLSNDLRLLTLVTGAVVADVAFGLIADGPALPIGWAVTGVGFAVLVRRGPGSAGSPEGVLAQTGLGGHLGLSLLSAFAVSDPVQVLHGYQPLSAAGAAAVAALAAGCLVSARIADEKHPQWGTALDAVGLGAVAVLTAMSLEGLQLVLAWTVEAVALAAIARRTYDEVAALGALGFLALTAIHVIAFEVPPVSLANGLDEPGVAVAALLTLGGSLLLTGIWAAEAKQPRLATALKALAALTLLYLTGVTLDGLQLELVLTAEVVALAAIARRTGDEVARVTALCFVAPAAIHAVVYEAPPVSLVTGLADPAAAVVALAAVAGCLVLLAAWAESEPPELRTALRALAALALLYLASTAVVTPFESDSAVDSALLSAHQQGQMVLSVFWGLVGVGTVVVGLRRDLGIVRIAGLALLGVAVTKVFLFDLATLTSVYRVVSFIGLGLLLLGGALVWQRLRPRALSDLRQTPAGVR
jgi:uncharacterized membrane protein